MVEVRIGDDIKIGGKNPCFIIAEVGQNHQGDIEIAKKLIKAAKVSLDTIFVTSRKPKAFLFVTADLHFRLFVCIHPKPKVPTLCKILCTHSIRLCMYAYYCL